MMKTFHLGGTDQSLRPKATIMVTPLPRCRKCLNVHPEAMSPPILTGICPNCGTPAREGRTQFVTSEINWSGSPWGRVAKLCYDIADKLKRLIERID